MSAVIVGSVAFACLFGGALLGIRLRRSLPGHHLADDSRHLLEIGLGIIGTMAGLVLGLLVASASGAYNTQRAELVDVSSKIVVLDRLLAHYGPEANAPRTTLRLVVQRVLDQTWPKEGAGGPRVDPRAARGEVLLDQLEELPATNDRQRSLKAAALGLAMNLAQTRWLMYEQADQSISGALLVLLVFWFTITFIGFGLFAPSNTTVIVALGLCALAVSGAIFITMEMYTPFQGIVRAIECAIARRPDATRALAHLPMRNHRPASPPAWSLLSSDFLHGGLVRFLP